MEPRDNPHQDNGGLAAAHHGTGTLGKAMAVLDIVASSAEPPRFTHILSRSGEPRGTLHRRLSHLVEEGLLNQRPDLSYELGYKLLKFASRAWAGNEFRKIAEPHLRNLHKQTDETVHLGVLRDNQVIYLDKVEGTQSVRMYSQIGNASPVYCTGVGKAALSVLPADEFDRCVGAIQFHKYTESTLLDVEALRVEVGTIRQTGIAYDLEEHEVGIRCVAAPIRSLDSAFFAGVSVTGPAYRVSYDTLESWAGLVQSTAGAIMEDMRTRLGPRS